MKKLLLLLLLLSGWALAQDALSGESNKYENTEMAFIVRVPVEFKKREKAGENEVAWDGPDIRGIPTAFSVRRGNLGTDPHAQALAFHGKIKAEEANYEVKLLDLPGGKATGVFWGSFANDQSKLYTLHMKWYFPTRHYYLLEASGPCTPDIETGLKRSYLALFETFNPVEP